MIIKVSILVDIDTENTDIEDLREEIVMEAMNTLENHSENADLEPVE